MKKPWAIGVAFASGALLGWGLRGGGREEIQKQEAAQFASKREDRPAKTPHDAKWVNFGKQVGRFSEQEKQDFLKRLEPKDRFKALLAIASQAGPSGLHYQLHNMVASILHELARENWEETWEASLTVENDGTRRYLLQELLNLQADSNPERAFALYLGCVADDPMLSSSVPSKMAELKAREGTRAFLDFWAKFPAVDSGSRYMTDATFAEDFDFRLVAEEFERSKASERPFVLKNFTSEWTKRDPEAVYDCLKRGGLDSNEWNGLFVGLAERTGLGEASAWVAGKLEDPNEPREKIMGGIVRGMTDGFTRQLNSAQILSVAQALPDTESRDRFFTELVAHADYQPVERFAFAFKELSTPEARLNALKELHAKYPAIPDGSLPDSLLATWGVTRQQVDAVLKAKN
jgi:hypothetical protein